MANKNPKKENLIPLSERNPTEKKALQQKGGKMSAKIRQERKKLKDELLYLLKIEDKTGKTMQERMCLALIQEAINGKVEAFKTIENTIGEKQAEVIQERITEDISENTINRVFEKLKEL